MFKGDITNRKFLESLPAFTEAVQKNMSVIFDKNGQWSIEGTFKESFRNLFNLQYSRQQSVVRNLIRVLRSLEREPILFPRKSSDSVKQKIDYDSLVSAVQSVIDQYDCASELNKYLVALKYRLEASNGGLDKAKFDQGMYDSLIGLALSWKLDYPTINEDTLNKTDRKQLRETCHYHEFTELLLQDEPLRNDFFVWALRDGNSVQPYVEFPVIKEEMVDCLLNGRISRHGGKGLKVLLQVNESLSLEKVATLPIEGKDVSILDKSKEVVFRGGMRMTIGQVLEVFREKYGDMGVLEYMADGIINWNVFLWAWWNDEEHKYEQIDLNKNGWWRDLPVFEILTKKQAQRRYGDHLDGVIWNVAAVSTRGSLSLDFEDSHAFEEICVPTGDGRYRIYPFGKWATEWPVTFFGKLTSVGKTLPATISSADENVFYTFRQHTRHSFGITPQQGMTLMEGAKEDLINGIEGNFVYQIESENCAKWVQLQIERAVGSENVQNLFITPLLNAEPSGMCKIIFDSIRSLPKSMQVRALTLVHVPLGALSGLWIEENGKEVWKALNHHEFWETGVVYLPAFLHNQQDRGLIDHLTDLFKKVFDTYITFWNFVKGLFVCDENEKITEQPYLSSEKRDANLEFDLIPILISGQPLSRCETSL